MDADILEENAAAQRNAGQAEREGPQIAEMNIDFMNVKGEGAKAKERPD